MRKPLVLMTPKSLLRHPECVSEEADFGVLFLHNEGFSTMCGHGIIGVVTVVIRTWGGLPEGVMYAILLGNAVTPHLDRWFRPTVYGTRRKEASS